MGLRLGLVLVKPRNMTNTIASIGYDRGLQGQRQGHKVRRDNLMIFFLNNVGDMYMFSMPNIPILTL